MYASPEVVLCHSVPTPPEGFVDIVGSLALFVELEAFVNKAPLTAGNLPLPSSTTILLAVEPVSIRATGIVPVAMLPAAIAVT